MIKVSASLLFVLLLATACSTPGTTRVVRFHQQDQANPAATDDRTSEVKPATTEQENQNHHQ